MFLGNENLKKGTGDSFSFNSWQKPTYLQQIVVTLATELELHTDGFSSRFSSNLMILFKSLIILYWYWLINFILLEKIVTNMEAKKGMFLLARLVFLKFQFNS